MSDDPSVALALMAYREVLPETVKSLIRDLRIYPDIRFVWAGNDALIDRTRSMIATYFLRNDSLFQSPGRHLDVLVMIDHDVAWSEGDLMNLARAAHYRDAVIAGVYPKRGFGTTLPIRTVSGKETIRIPSDNLIRCQYVSAGFMAIPWTVLNTLADPTEAAGSSLAMTILGYRQFFLPIEVAVSDGGIEPLSEDWAFCWRVRKWAERPVLADLRAHLTHTGPYPFRTIDSMSVPAPDRTIEYTETTGFLGEGRTK